MIMDEADGPKSVIFAILDRELEKLEETASDSTDQNIMDARTKMFDAVSVMQLARYACGMAIMDYRAILLQSAKENEEWRDIADETIAKALGYNVKSVKNLIQDAVRADQIGQDFRNAMVARGYDPAAARNKDIVSSLAGKLWPQTLRGAAEIVDWAIKNPAVGKTDQPIEADAKRQRRLVNQVAELVIEQPRRARRGKLTEVFDQVKNVLVADRTKAAGGTDSQGGGPVPTVESGTPKRPGPVAVPKPAGPAISGTGKPKPPRKAPPTPGQYRKHVHPWGDVCLNTLRLQNPGPAGTGAGEFHRKLLYDARDKSKPTRYLVAGMLDLFDPGVPDRVFDEHMKVFLDASQHTFLALTPHADSIRRHWERLNRDFPDNFWPGISVDCVDHIKRLINLCDTGIRTQWASFLDYHSDPTRPLSTSDFRSELRDAELVVFGWDFADPPSPLSREDACSLAVAALRLDEIFFFTHPRSKQAFFSGAPNISDLPEPMKPSMNNPKLDRLIDRAQSLQNLPSGWLRHADWARKPHFKTFEGEKVELFDLRSEIGESPAAIAEAS